MRNLYNTRPGASGQVKRRTNLFAKPNKFKNAYAKVKAAKEITTAGILEIVNSGNTGRLVLA